MFNRSRHTRISPGADEVFGPGTLLVRDPDGGHVEYEAIVHVPDDVIQGTADSARLRAVQQVARLVGLELTLQSQTVQGPTQRCGLFNSVFVSTFLYG